MQMQCKAALYLSSGIVWDVNLVRKLHYIRETRCRDCLPSEGTTREHPGAAVPIKFRQRASGGGELLHRARRRHPGGRASPGTRSIGLPRLVSRACEGIQQSQNIPEWWYFLDIRDRQPVGACTRARTIYTGSLLNSVNGQPGAEF